MIDRGVTEAHVRAVLDIDDRVLRNYWITQSYADLSLALAALLAPDSANWCTFATWASRTVGENLRGEGLPDWLRERVVQDNGMMGAMAEANARPARRVGLVHHVTTDRIMDVVRDAFGATALNLSEGNSVVFAEIGLAGARFVAAYGAAAPRDTARASVLDACAAATPFEGVNRLQAGFSFWCDAMETDDVRLRSQRIMAGSVQLGAHEQNRLQAAVAASMDMGANQMATRLAQNLLKRAAWLRPLVWVVEHTLAPVTDSIARVWDDVMTEFVGAADTPDGKLRLGHDVPSLPGRPFLSPDLVAPRMPELETLLHRFDRSSGDGHGSAADNWVAFDDRMNFIVNLFLSRHHHPPMFDPPFPADVVAQLEAGTIPR
jgi:hypothetical protein